MYSLGPLKKEFNPRADIPILNDFIDGIILPNTAFRLRTSSARQFLNEGRTVMIQKYA